MPTSNTEELGRFLKCTVIGRGVFGPCACWFLMVFYVSLVNSLQGIHGVSIEGVPSIVQSGKCVQ